MVEKEIESFIKSREYLILSCIKRLGIYKDYDEFYQVGLIALYQAILKYNVNQDPHKNFDVYAYYTILNYMKNELKKAKRFASIEELIDDYQTKPYGCVFEDEVINRMELEYLMRSLTDEERELIELKKLGLKNNEIAAYLNMDEYQMKNKLKVIFKKIREVVEKVKVN